MRTGGSVRRFILDTLRLKCPWHAKIGNNGMKLSSEGKAWDVQVDNKRTGRGEGSKVRTQRRDPRDTEVQPRDCTRTNKSVVEGKHERFKKERGVIGETKLETTNRRGQRSQSLKGKGEERPLESTLRRAPVTFRGAQVANA